MTVKMLLTLSKEVAGTLAAMGWFFTGKETEFLTVGGSKEDLKNLAAKLAEQNQETAVVLLESFMGFSEMFPRDWLFGDTDRWVVPLLQFDAKKDNGATTGWTFHIVPFDSIKQDNFYGKLFRHPW